MVSNWISNKSLIVSSRWAIALFWETKLLPTEFTIFSSWVKLRDEMLVSSNDSKVAIVLLEIEIPLLGSLSESNDCTNLAIAIKLVSLDTFASRFKIFWNVTYLLTFEPAIFPSIILPILNSTLQSSLYWKLPFFLVIPLIVPQL